MNLHPTYLKPKDMLTDTQRKSLGLPKTAPRKRQLGEATSVFINNGSMKGEPYYTGYGEVIQPMREGALRAMQLPSRGM